MIAGEVKCIRTYSDIKCAQGTTSIIRYRSYENFDQFKSRYNLYVLSGIRKYLAIFIDSYFPLNKKIVRLNNVPSMNAESCRLQYQHVSLWYDEKSKQNKTK